MAGSEERKSIPVGFRYIHLESKGQKQLTFCAAVLEVEITSALGEDCSLR